MNTAIYPFRAACLAGLALALVSTLSVRAADDGSTALPRTTLGVEGGTTGVGPTVTFVATPKWTFSFGYAWLSYGHDVDGDSATYSGKLELSNFSGVVNWHPTAGMFHLSAGGYITNNKVDLTGEPTGGALFELGNNTYTTAQVGQLTGRAKLGSGVAPYLGFGWSKTPGRRGWGASLELGALFTGSPKATLHATGPIASDAVFLADLAAETRSINDDVDSFKIYPVIKAGLSYCF